MEEVVKKLGFASEAEFHQMVASVPKVDAAFIAWRDNDGTKAGLLKILEPKR